MLLMFHKQIPESIVPIHLSPPSTFCFERLVLPVLNKYLKREDSTILDFGCGHGVWRFVFDLRERKYVGFDVIKREWTKYDTSNASFLVSNGACTPFANETFDFLLCNCVLEHVTDDKEAIKEIVRVLKKSKYGLITVPTNNWSLLFNEVPYLPARAFGKNFDHGERYYSISRISRLLRNEKLKIVELFCYLGIFGSIVQAIFTYGPVFKWYFVIFLNKMLRLNLNVELFKFSRVYGSRDECELRSIQQNELREMTLFHQIYTFLMILAYRIDRKMDSRKGGEICIVCQKM